MELFKLYLFQPHKRKWEYSKFISRHYYFITRLNRPLNTRSGLAYSTWFQPLFTVIVGSYALAKWFVRILPPASAVSQQLAPLTSLYLYYDSNKKEGAQ
jgi:hypothetical protein